MAPVRTGAIVMSEAQILEQPQMGFGIDQTGIDADIHIEQAALVVGAIPAITARPRTGA